MKTNENPGEDHGEDQHRGPKWNKTLTAIAIKSVGGPLRTMANPKRRKNTGKNDGPPNAPVGE